MKKRKLFTVLSLGLLFMLSGCFGSSSSSSGSNSGSDSGDKKGDTSEPVNNSDEYFTYDGSSVKAKDTSISGDLVIPSEFNGQSITTIPKDAFKNCSQITSIVVPNSVTSIAKGAFAGCIKLDSITLPFVGISRDTTTPQNKIFGEIFGDVEYTGGTKVSQYGYNQWNRYIPSGLRKVTITDTTQIGEKAFNYCSMLTEINLNDKIVAIGAETFANCSSIKKLYLPNIYDIPKSAFKACSSLESFEINEKITTIGSSAFSGCINLSSINSTTDGDFIIPKTVQSIGKYAFKSCIKLTSITLPFVGISRDTTTPQNRIFGEIFGDEEYTGGTKVSQYGYNQWNRYIPSGLRKVTITDATQIGEKAFNYCSMLTELNINSAVAGNIGANAFGNCVTPHYFSTVELKEDISGTVKLNGNTEGGAVLEDNKILNITDEMKTSFNNSSCKYVYFSIYYDNYGEKVNVFDNWGMVDFSFLDKDGNELFKSNDIVMKHNDKYATDVFNHKMTIADFNKLATVDLHFWYDKQDVLGASGNWSYQDYNVKNIKVVMQSI